MSIGKYLKEIGRGKEGARALSREQAADLFGQVLDKAVSDLEIGAFCAAMRIKGETAQEMAGFLDAAQARMTPVQINANPLPTIIIPSYNGARKLPGLTALLALLLARKGYAVLVHGMPTEDKRVFVTDVLEALSVAIRHPNEPLNASEVAFYPTRALCPGLQELLDVRRLMQLRNSAHSLVKLMLPCHGPSILISSYTHPEYAISMADTLALMETNCLLLRGTEGESVADPRRTPQMDLFVSGQLTASFAAQGGSLSTLPDLPTGMDATSTAAYIQHVLDGKTPIPTPIALQIDRIVQLTHMMRLPSRHQDQGPGDAL